MDYVQLSDTDRRAMLNTIGVDRVEDLYNGLQDKHRLDQPLRLTGLTHGLSELTLQQRLTELAARNHPAGANGTACFLGGGAYDHFIPAVVDQLAAQGAFLTAYTPYQAEASQGSLQAFFEFQTQVCRLTGMDIANASLYEGTTAAAEAVYLALNVTGKRRVLVASTVHPHTRRVIATYLADLPAQVIEIPAAGGKTDPATLAEHLDNDTACVVVQSPNVYGLIEDWTALFAEAHHHPKTLAVAAFNPTACGLLKRPGTCDADIAVGEGQPLGIPLQYGGPYLGLFAARQSLMRKMPGRLVGQTTDAKGRRAYCLTLQTREQHIRGEKATSNICTNQGLLALRATIYLSTLGPAGLREVAGHCYHKAHHAADRIAALPGYALKHQGEFFHEFVVRCPRPAADVIQLAKTRGVLPGLDCHALGIGDENDLLVAVTERRTAAQIDTLIDALSEVS